MSRDIREIVSEIDALAPVNPDDLDLEILQALVDEYFSLADAPAHLDVWFRLYERFPESDGFGVFWSILHGIEAQPDSSRFVLTSVQRQPTHFPILMVNRILNVGIGSVGGVGLVDLLRSVAADIRWSANVRKDAQGFLDYQQRRAESSVTPNERGETGSAQ